MTATITDTDAAEEQTTPPAPELLHVDPADLLIDRNIRELNIDKAFTASIKRHGVLMPIVAVRTDAGLRVRLGNRRTAAAASLNLPSVPVYVTGDEDGDQAARIVGQMVENDHRAALTNSERVEAVHQLALIGLSAAQIATRTASPRKNVDAALTVAKSALATGAAGRYDFLTLDQSAVIAGYDDDTKAVTQLVAAAKLGPVEFDRAAIEVRDEREDRNRRQVALDALAEAGYPIIEEPIYHEKPRTLNRIMGADGEPLTVAAHANCPGRAGWVREDWVRNPDAPPLPAGDEDSTADDGESDEENWVLAYVPTFGCADPATHHPRPVASADDTPAHSEDRQTDDEARAAREARDAERVRLAAEAQAKERADRAHVKTHNKQWRDTEPIRRAWIGNLLRRKTAPAGTAAFLTSCLVFGIPNPTSVSTAPHDLLTGWLGTSGQDDVTAAANDATETRALVIALAVVASRHEHAMDIHTWRNTHRDIGRYLTFLETLGYPLTDAEGYVLGRSPSPATDDTQNVQAEEHGMVA